MEHNFIYKIGILNGPNMNMLGIREPEIYGEKSIGNIMNDMIQMANDLSVEVMYFQSNHEGEMIDFVQKNFKELDAIILNPAAFSINGYALLDTLVTLDIPYIEIHLSNIAKRGGWHSKTIFAQSAIGHISGFKGYGYCLALLAIKRYLDEK